MSLASVRAAIAAHYTSTIKDAYTTEHGGAFSLEDIKRYGKRSPAIIVGCLGVPSFEVQGSVVTATAVYGVYCLSMNQKGTLRDVACLLLAESVAVETIAKNWGGEASSSPRNVTGQNLYTKKLDAINAAMWGIQWEQNVDLTRNAITELDDFLTMESTYDIGETDDTVDTTDITELPQ